jgi:DNA phosphorothioation-dependent restriction protein DptH
MPGDMARDLARAESDFNPKGWEVRIVTDKTDAARRAITSDQAVALREAKGAPLLLLIDTTMAGAGMDGIYSASREIDERMMQLAVAKEIKNRKLDQLQTLAQSAVDAANRLYRRQGDADWVRLFFLGLVAAHPEQFGRWIATIGLWPSLIPTEKFELKHIDMSARLVQRLLLGDGPQKTVDSRLAALGIVGVDAQQQLALMQVADEAQRQPAFDVVQKIASIENIWLERLNVGFDNHQVSSIKLRPWRNPKGILTKWSGLVDNGENIPLFLLPEDESVPVSKQSKLEVRFVVQPEELAAGSVEYKIAVQSGGRELASRNHTHQAKSDQTVRLTIEDFADFDIDAALECEVIVTVVGSESIQSDPSEDFVVKRGIAPKDIVSGGTRSTTRFLDVALMIADAATYDAQVASQSAFSVDPIKGAKQFRPATTQLKYKMAYPSVLHRIEQGDDGQNIGRWQVRVRSDGGVNPETLQFLPIDTGIDQNRLASELRRFWITAHALGGSWGRVYSPEHAQDAAEYVSAWSALLEAGGSEAAWLHTLEVRSLSGDFTGLIMLPSHPLRVAWQSGLDLLARYMRYEQGMSAGDVVKELSALDGSYLPAHMPGASPGETLVYADTLGAYASALVRSDEKEPRTAVALLKAALGLSEDEVVTALGISTSTVLGNEVNRYVEFHAQERGAEKQGKLMKLHGLRAGDGLVLARALGAVVGIDAESVRGESSAAQTREDLRFELNLYPADPMSDVTGRHLQKIAEKYRTGVSGIAEDDRWLVESSHGNSRIPMFRWARKPSALPESAAHVSVAFDVFDTHVERGDLPNAPASLLAFGLQVGVERQFQSAPDVRWHSWLPARYEGERHPAGKGYTDRLIRAHKAMLSSCAQNLGDKEGWPVMTTRLPYDGLQTLTQIHKLSDWVITVDRNAGLEFFDSPRENPEVFDAFVIDCVPERTDLGSMRMVTSTTNIDEVRDILEELLHAMGVSSSQTQCDRLLRSLKGLSGRLAMRLTHRGSRTEELVALSCVFDNCQRAAIDSSDWLPLSEGFFVPLDDIRDLLPLPKDRAAGERNVRSDLIYVALGLRRSGLTFTFVEVKYRRQRRDAGDDVLHQHISEQLVGTKRDWLNLYFNPKLSEPVLLLRRARLARVLRFYADKAARHTLSAERHGQLVREFDKLLNNPRSYAVAERPDDLRGYIFCPAIIGSNPVEAMPGKCTVRLFGWGQSLTLDSSVAQRSPSSQSDVQLPAGDTINAPEAVPPTDSSNVDATQPAEIVSVPGAENQPIAAIARVEIVSPAERVRPLVADSLAEGQHAAIELGINTSTDETVQWRVSSKANPHLMVVGLPGMGKTEALLNISRQLYQQNIVPIVLSYHPDIDERMQSTLGDVQLYKHSQLGYNPMQVSGKAEFAHLDNAGALKDIFSAIWPDLGDVQLAELRKSIVWSYEQAGWGTEQSENKRIPEFATFYRRLKQGDHPDKGLKALLVRLDELHDYGLFQSHGEARSLLASTKPSIVGLHHTDSDMLQRAMAMFVLHGIYSDMFRRGVQPRITHAIIVDEAHRAAKLKLLIKLAKEGRKFGLAVILASQAVNDFDPDLYSGIASYLLLRMTEHDAMSLARAIWPSDISRGMADRLKQISKYHAIFSQESQSKPSIVKLNAFQS